MKQSFILRDKVQLHDFTIERHVCAVKASKLVMSFNDDVVHCFFKRKISLALKVIDTVTNDWVTNYIKMCCSELGFVASLMYIG